MQLLILLVSFLYISSSDGKLVILDLTHDFDNVTTAYWGMIDRFHFVKQLVSDANSSTYYESNVFMASEHGGTHLDAPRHFALGKHGVNEVSLTRLIGKPFIVDVSADAANNPDLEVSVSHLESAEKSQGKIPDDSILLIYTGWSLKYNNLSSYFGGDDLKNPSTYHFPGIHPDAAKWLVANRNIACVGIDTPSIDFGQSTMFQTHVILYTENIPGLENVDLSKITTIADKHDLQIIALPMKIKDGSGAPLRIIATYDDESSKSSSQSLTTSSIVSLISVAIILFVV